MTKKNYEATITLADGSTETFTRKSDRDYYAVVVTVTDRKAALTYWLDQEAMYLKLEEKAQGDLDSLEEKYVRSYDKAKAAWDAAKASGNPYPSKVPSRTRKGRILTRIENNRWGAKYAADQVAFWTKKPEGFQAIGETTWTGRPDLAAKAATRLSTCGGKGVIVPCQVKVKESRKVAAARKKVAALQAALQAAESELQAALQEEK